MKTVESNMFRLKLPTIHLAEGGGGERVSRERLGQRGDADKVFVIRGMVGAC